MNRIDEYYLKYLNFSLIDAVLAGIQTVTPDPNRGIKWALSLACCFSLILIYYKLRNAESSFGSLQ